MIHYSARDAATSPSLELPYTSVMPPHLHPRSRATASLFTTTLAISFLVVATPHLLPCPVDRRALADSAGPEAFNGQKRWRRRKVTEEETCNTVMHEERRRKEDEKAQWEVPKRECPVPKPGGLIGQVLGVRKEEKVEEEGRIRREISRARRKSENEQENGK